MSVFLFDEDDDPRVRRISIDDPQSSSHPSYGLGTRYGEELEEAVAELANGPSAVSHIRAASYSSSTGALGSSFHHHRRRESSAAAGSGTGVLNGIAELIGSGGVDDALLDKLGYVEVQDEEDAPLQVPSIPLSSSGVDRVDAGGFLGRAKEFVLESYIADDAVEAKAPPLSSGARRPPLPAQKAPPTSPVPPPPDQTELVPPQHAISPLPSRPRKIGPEDFAFLRVIGHGAYGRVFLVRHTLSQRIYAMKTLRKASIVVHEKYTEHSRTEREILSAVQHPFIVKLHYAFQSPRRLYLVLDYVGGGELFSYMARERMFTEEQAKFVCCELILALEHLHSLGIIYRDLKPENILLDRAGHIVLTDFGLSKIPLGGSANTICGTVEYMSPECIMQRTSYDSGADWWSLGIILYDMLTGAPPFRGPTRKATMDAILGRKLRLPPYFGPDVKDILTRLLKKHPVSRLGAKAGAAEIKAHRWFHTTDWAKVLRKELRPPFVPMMTADDDVSNFDAAFTSQAVAADPDTPMATPVTPSANGLFMGFSYVASHMSPTW